MADDYDETSALVDQLRAIQKTAEYLATWAQDLGLSKAAHLLALCSDTLDRDVIRRSGTIDKPN